MGHRVTFVINEQLQQELQECIIRDRYGLRGKSRWVCEAISQLLEIKTFIELVNYSTTMHNFNRKETVVIDESLKIILNDAIVQVRKEYPTFEGVQSSIIRTAIIQRLIRN